MPAAIHTPIGSANGKTLLFCHGFRGSKEGGGRATALAEQVASHGFNAVRFDFTPLSTLSRQVAELSAVADFCRRQFGPELILLGRSMGGSAVLAYAASDQRVAGLCLWATPHNLHETFRLALGTGYDKLIKGETLFAEDEWGKLSLTPEFIRDFDNFDLLESVEALPAVPLLLVHGRADAVVPVSHAQTIYQLAREPKKLVIIPEADHQFLRHYDEAGSAVLTWLVAEFPGKSI